MLYALLFLPALLAVAFVLTRRRQHTLAEETVVANPFAELDALLTELESATLEGRTAAELEVLADRLERIA